MKFVNVQRLINEEFSDFYIDSIVKIGEGWDNKAFLINHDWIFRFPKRPEVTGNLKKEAALLPVLRKFLKLEIPDFEYVSNKATFAAYKKLEGIFFSKKIFNSFTETKQEIILQQLADFLMALHQFDCRAFKITGLEEINYREYYTKEFNKFQQLIYPEIAEAFQKKITAAFNSFLNNDSNFKYKKSLLHNDISSNHILYDPSKEILSGVIDFGDIAMGDPDYDLLYLYDEYGAAFITRLLKYYQRPDPADLLRKLSFYRLAEILKTIIHHTSEQQISKAERSYKNLYRLLNAI